MRIEKKNKYVSLSFDIEDWFQVESFKTIFPFETWDEQELRVEKGTELILSLLEKYNIKATFFILGWIAEKKPQLIKKIYNCGHEIASHGYYHQLNYNMSKNELYDDLIKSKEIIEYIINDRIAGYRAPTFSVSNEVIELLEKVGFKYDSSFNQFSKHDRYGVLSDYTSDMIFDASNKITEVSIPAVKILKQEIPIAGGGFFRLYPVSLSKVLVKKHFKNNDYYVFYAHPWEFDPEMPRVKKASFLNEFRHYINIQTNYRKLDNFIKYLKLMGCEFVPINEYLNMRK